MPNHKHLPEQANQNTYASSGPDHLAWQVGQRRQLARQLVSPWAQRWLAPDLRLKSDDKPLRKYPRPGLLTETSVRSHSVGPVQLTPRTEVMSSNGRALQHFAKTITQRFPLPRRNYPVRQMKNVGRQGMILVGENETTPTTESNPGWLEAMPSFDEVRRRFETGRQQSPHEETKPTRPGPVGPPEIQRTSTESNPDWLEAMPSFDEVRRRFEAAKVHTPVSGTPLSLQAGAKQTPSGQRSSTLPRTTPPVLPRKPTGNRRVVSRVQEVTSGKQAGPQADLSGQTGDSPHIGPSSEPANVLPETAPKLEASPVQTQSVQTQSVQTTPPNPASLPSDAITSEIGDVGPTDEPPAALLASPSSQSNNTQSSSQTKPTQQPDWPAAILSKSEASQAVQRSPLKPPGTTTSESSIKTDSSSEQQQPGASPSQTETNMGLVPGGSPPSVQNTMAADAATPDKSLPEAVDLTLKTRDIIRPETDDNRPISPAQSQAQEMETSVFPSSSPSPLSILQRQSQPETSSTRTQLSEPAISSEGKSGLVGTEEVNQVAPIEPQESETQSAPPEIPTDRQSTISRTHSPAATEPIETLSRPNPEFSASLSTERQTNESSEPNSVTEPLELTSVQRMQHEPVQETFDPPMDKLQGIEDISAPPISTPPTTTYTSESSLAQQAATTPPAAPTHVNFGLSQAVIDRREVSRRLSTLRSKPLLNHLRVQPQALVQRAAPPSSPDKPRLNPSAESALPLAEPRLSKGGARPNSGLIPSLPVIPTAIDSAAGFPIQRQPSASPVAAPPIEPAASPDHDIIQRDHASAPPVEEAVTPPTEESPNLDDLARQVYPLIKRLLAIEWERRAVR